MLSLTSGQFVNYEDDEMQVTSLLSSPSIVSCFKSCSFHSLTCSSHEESNPEQQEGETLLSARWSENISETIIELSISPLYDLFEVGGSENAHYISCIIDHEFPAVPEEDDAREENEEKKNKSGEGLNDAIQEAEERMEENEQVVHGGQEEADERNRESIDLDMAWKQLPLIFQLEIEEKKIILRNFIQNSFFKKRRKMKKRITDGETLQYFNDLSYTNEISVLNTYIFDNNRFPPEFLLLLHSRFLTTE